jgi:phosphohistidine phosphatase
MSETERFVVLLRHGIAEERSAKVKEEERALTAEGHQKMKEIAHGLARIFPDADAIYSSPLVRAMQTAEHVVKAYKGRLEIEITDALVPDASTKELRWLLAKSRARQIIAVGHEPNLTENVCALAALSNAARVELKKGGCYGVRLQADGNGVLEWVLTPRVLREV